MKRLNWLVALFVSFSLLVVPFASAQESPATPEAAEVPSEVWSTVMFTGLVPDLVSPFYEVQSSEGVLTSGMATPGERSFAHVPLAAGETATLVVYGNDSYLPAEASAVADESGAVRLEVTLTLVLISTPEEPDETVAPVAATETPLLDEDGDDASVTPESTVETVAPVVPTETPPMDEDGDDVSVTPESPEETPALDRDADELTSPGPEDSVSTPFSTAEPGSISEPNTTQQEREESVENSSNDLHVSSDETEYGSLHLRDTVNLYSMHVTIFDAEGVEYDNVIVDGLKTLQLPVGNYTYSYSSTAYVPGSGAFSIVSGETLEIDLEPEVIPGSFVTIDIVQAAGFRSEYPMALISDSQGAVVVAKTLPWLGGIVEFGYLPSGDYVLQLRNGGDWFPDFDMPLTVTTDGPSLNQLEWPLRDGTLVSIEVRLPSGVELNQMTFSFRDLDWGFEYFPWPTETLSHEMMVPAGQYIISVRQFGVLPYEKTIEVVEGVPQHVVVELQPTVEMSVHFVHENGEPARSLGGYTVQQQNGGSGLDIKWLAAEPGSIKWEGPPGVYKVKLEPWGVYQQQEFLDLSFSAEEPVKTLTLVSFPNLGTVTMPTVAGPSHEGGRYGYIQFSSNDRPDWAFRVSFHFDEPPIEFQLPVGEYSVRVRPPTGRYLEYESTVFVGSSGVTVLEVDFLPLPPVTLTLLDGAGHPLEGLRATAHYAECFEEGAVGENGYPIQGAPSDANGTVEFGCQPGVHRISVYNGFNLVTTIEIDVGEQGYSGIVVINSGAASAGVHGATITSGNQFEVSGAGFYPDDEVSVYLNAIQGAPIGVVQSDYNGGFRTQLAMPYTTPPGSHTLIFLGSGLREVRVPVQVVAAEGREFSLVPSSGQAGSTTTVSGSGFAPGDSVEIRWNTRSGILLATLTASSEGTISGTVTIPPHAVIATRTVHAIGSSGQTATTTFSVDELSVASISLGVTSGPIGTETVVTGANFAPGEKVNVKIGYQTQLGTATANSSGSFSLSVTIPSTVTPGVKTITATGANSERSATATFTRTQATAAIELSVTSGPTGTKTIVTGTNFRAGEKVNVKIGYQTQLGTATANSSGSFNLSVTIPSTVTPGVKTITATGATSGSVATATYTCTQATASISLSVTSGPTGTTTVVTGTNFRAGEKVNVKIGYQTQLGTATANSSGSFSLSVTIPSTVTPGVKTITATGATSGSVATATYTCTQATASISLSVTSGPTGTTTVVTGTNFRAGEKVNVKIGYQTQLGTATANSSGSFSLSVTIPSTVTLGVKTITATGATSGNAATATYTCTAGSQISLSVTSGPTGTTTVVTGTNFRAGEKVNVKIGYQTQLGTATANSSGSFSLSVTIPSTVTLGVKTITATGATSGSVATATYTCTQAVANIMLSADGGPTGTTTIVSGTNFRAGEKVNVKIGYQTQLGTATADSTGSFSLSVTIPSTVTLGVKTITATGATSGSVATATYTCTQPSVIRAEGEIRVTLVEPSGESPRGFLDLAAQNTATGEYYYFHHLNLRVDSGVYTSESIPVGTYTVYVNDYRDDYEDVVLENVVVSTSITQISIDLQEHPRVNLTWVVTTNGIPVANAQVNGDINTWSRQGLSLTTDESGVATVSVPVGVNVTWRIDSPMFQIFEGEWTPGEATTIETDLGSKLRSIEVTVRDQHGDLAQGYYLYGTSESCTLAHMEGYEPSDGTDTLYVRDPARTSCDLSLRSPFDAYQLDPSTVTVELTGQVTQVELTVTRAETVVGPVEIHIVSHNDGARGPAVLWVQGEQMQWPESFGIRKNGVATISALPTGDYTLHALIYGRPGTEFIVEPEVISIDADSLNFTIDAYLPEITLSPVSGMAGSTITYSGDRFLPGETVTIHDGGIYGQAIDTTTASSTGTISGSVTVSNGAEQGDVYIHAWGRDSGYRGYAAFTVTGTLEPTIELSTTSGPTGTTTTVSGSNFRAYETVRIRIGSATQIGEAYADSEGSFTLPVTIPGTVTPGVKTITVTGESSRRTATATYTTTETTASISLSVRSGPTGTTTMVTGTNFRAGEKVNVKIGYQTQLGTATVNSNGSFSLSVTIPSTVTLGVKTITATGATSGSVATATYTCTSPTAYWRNEFQDGWRVA